MFSHPDSISNMDKKFTQELTLSRFFPDFFRVFSGFCPGFVRIWSGFCLDFVWILSGFFPDFYLAHVIEKPNLRIPNPQYFLLFKWKFDNFFIHFEFDRGDKKTKCIHKSNVIKKIVVNIGDSEFVNLVFRWREQDKCEDNHLWGQLLMRTISRTICHSFFRH